MLGVRRALFARRPARAARALSLFGGGPPDSALPGGVVGEGERWIDEEDARRRTQEILARCEALHQKLQPLNERLRGPLERNSEDTMMLPFVLLLGNHSSGKSSFLNHVLERRIQTAGVAPTDDSFTIVSPGPADIDQDGPALVGDPDMGFQGLRQYGPGLIHHMQLKIRADVRGSAASCARVHAVGSSGAHVFVRIARSPPLPPR